MCLCYFFMSGTKYLNSDSLLYRMPNEMSTILSRMDEMKKDLETIKKNMVEKDEIMTLTEFEAYKESLDKKNLVSLEDAKKQLGL